MRTGRGGECRWAGLTAASGSAARRRPAELRFPFHAEHLQGAIGDVMGFDELAGRGQPIGLLAQFPDLGELGRRDPRRREGLVDGNELAGWMAGTHAGEPCLVVTMATVKIPMTTSDASANRTMQPSLRKSSCWVLCRARPRLRSRFFAAYDAYPGRLIAGGAG